MHTVIKWLSRIREQPYWPMLMWMLFLVRACQFIFIVIKLIVRIKRDLAEPLQPISSWATLLYFDLFPLISFFWQYIGSRALSMMMSRREKVTSDDEVSLVNDTPPQSISEACLVVLQQVHPRMFITPDAMEMMENIIEDLTIRCVDGMCEDVKKTKAKANANANASNKASVSTLEITHEDVISALRVEENSSSFVASISITNNTKHQASEPNQLCLHAASEIQKAMTKLTTCRDPRRLAFVSVAAGLCMHIESIEDIARRALPITRGKGPKWSISQQAVVALAALAEYIVAESCELAGNAARAAGSEDITLDVMRQVYGLGSTTPPTPAKKSPKMKKLTMQANADAELAAMAVNRTIKYFDSDDI